MQPVRVAQAEPHDLVLVDEVGRAQHLDREARGTQPIGEVGCVQTDVVVLPERRQARVGRDDGRVLVGRAARRVDRHERQQPPLRAQDPAQLAHGLRVLGHVLEHVAADDPVEECVGQLERGDVQSEVPGELGLEVTRDVPQAADRVQAPAQAPLRREVQEIRRAREQLGPTLEQQPLQAMALMGAAPPTQRARAVPVVLERVKAPAADRAGNRVAAVAMQVHPAADALGDARGDGHGARA